MRPTDYDDGYEEPVHCEHCGARVPLRRASSLDVSTADEYYPTLIYFCPSHAELAAEPEERIVPDGGSTPVGELRVEREKARVRIGMKLDGETHEAYLPPERPAEVAMWLTQAATDAKRWRIQQRGRP